MNKPATPTGAAEIGLLFVVAVWGVNFSVIKVALEVIPPFTVNLLRFTVSLAVLTGLHVIQCRAAGRSPLYDLKTYPLAVAVLGLMGHAVYQAGFILGIDRLTAGAGALLIASSPIWTSVVGHIRGIDRLSGGGWLGLAIGIVGVVLVILGQTNGQIDGEAIGAFLMLAAASAWGLTTVFTRPLLDKGASPLGITTAGLWVAYPVLFGMGLWGIGDMNWSQVGATEWAALVYSGGLSTGVAYWVWNVAVQRVGPSRTSAYANLVPVVGVAAGALLLHETITPLELAGGALVITGLVVMRRLR